MRLVLAVVAMLGTMRGAIAFAPGPHMLADRSVLLACRPRLSPHAYFTPRLCEEEDVERRNKNSLSLPWRSMAFGATGAGVVAVAGQSSLGRSALMFVLQALFTLTPIVSAVRLYRDGRRRAAFTLALSAAARRFCDRWWQYLTIPLCAGAVGWITNKVAVDMIFQPLEFRGLRLRTWPNQPLGLVGWQGIVPTKVCCCHVLGQ
jgi:hypothetical protein